jgi:hypothetical protein
MDDESLIWIDGFGNKFWLNKQKKLHRIDGPAREFENGHKEWWFNGVIHREDGPAAISPSGIKWWYFDGFSYETKEDWFNALSDEAKAKCLFSEDFLNG